MKIITSSIPKYVVYISLNEMWTNFMKSFYDFARYNTTSTVTNIMGRAHHAIINTKDPSLILDLFKDTSMTVALLGDDVVKQFDSSNDAYYQVVVLDKDGNHICEVDHHNINY